MLKTIFRFRAREVFDAAKITAIRNIDGPIGEALRYEYYQSKFKRIGRNVRIDTSVYISGTEYISIGDDVHIDKGVILVACAPDLDLSTRDLKWNLNPDAAGVVEIGELVIGNSSHIAQNCMIFAYGGIRLGTHCTLSAGCKLYSLTSAPWSPRDRSEHISIMPYSGRSPSIIGPILCGENVWLGVNCVVFPGVTLEQDCFARSNSLITSSMPENSYIRGDPGRRVGNRYS